MASTTTTTQHHDGHAAKQKVGPAIEFAHQAQRLGQYTPDQEDDATGSTQAIEAKFVTGQDPVIETANGGRLPAVPLDEAVKLNKLKDELEDRDPSQNDPVPCSARESKDGTVHGATPNSSSMETQRQEQPDAPLREAVPQRSTNPLFPPLPMYGPPGLMRDLQCYGFRFSSAILSFCFLLVILLGALFTSIPLAFRYVWMRLTFRDPNMYRPFYAEEKRRKASRKQAEREWKKQQNQFKAKNGFNKDKETAAGKTEEYVPLEGGPDPLVCDVSYYARRVGLDCETFEVQTEDGFIIELWHLFNPRETHAASSPHRAPHSPEVFRPGFVSHGVENGTSSSQYPFGSRKYPVLMLHGLLQSSGAYCSNDDDSLAFFLAKSGYDVWLGNNRCGFKPRHNMLEYKDPRMWAWNIRQMGVMDLPALISRVLSETGFEKLALIAHSQGTTETFVALAKEQRPDIGEKISVFCALAPAAYAGPLIGKMYFKFMQVISHGMFRAIFGIHAFIPFMMRMHGLLPGSFYGAMGYRIFSFLFNWTDERWEKDLRDRMFQFAPVYVSAESMRWWLGRECFAAQKCILATRREKELEEKEDEEEENGGYFCGDKPHPTERADSSQTSVARNQEASPSRSERGKYAWYDKRVPPMALWVAGADDLVDGRRLLRRFERGREPFVDVVHCKIIEGYEHLDVIWAMDALDKVGKEVREIIWRTAPEEARAICRVPTNCENAVPFERRDDGRIVLDGKNDHRGRPELDTTAGEWSDKLHGDDRMLHRLQHTHVS
ncbi:alpha/beta-hydrolase [Saccharata proteae CBS 121410]|uniref:Alpha/beta-hydrolase n=1 Tax=Saccharata proteae CBS 121410 TaxID=1314787 RepID=A0A9P4LXV0_9PEZI|nr:alpha/beta-hydrolase [Saccharata proteae CBS 121410]